VENQINQVAHQPKIDVDFAIEARWVAPVTQNTRLLENASVLLKQGIIIDILPTVEANSKYNPSLTVRLDEHVLIPGLINLHSHAAMSLMRGIADDLPLMTWLNEHIWPLEAQTLSQRFVYDGALLACAEMLKGGITCFNDMYFFPEATAQAATKAGMRAQIGLVVIDFPSPYASDADDYLLKGLNARDQWRGNALISSCIAPHAPYTISNQTFQKVMTYAEQLGLGVHTHLHETQDEIVQGIKQFGIRPIKRLADLGVLGPSLAAAHCVHMNDEDVQLMQYYGCHVAHCPTSNLKLATGIAPVTSMLSRHINIGLGTDGAASNNRLDMFAEMRLAALLSKGSSGDATTVPAEQALEMATINGAKALGLDHQIGSIEIGKLGDLTAVKLADIETMPCYDPISHLVYAAGREHVTHVWVQGELKYQKSDAYDGVFANIEPAELKEIINLWQPKLNQFK
jgi:5-methylthioadenosine/S-adenosylhomocysteine deaminase